MELRAELQTRMSKISNTHSGWKVIRVEEKRKTGQWGVRVGISVIWDREVGRWDVSQGLKEVKDRLLVEVWGSGLLNRDKGDSVYHSAGLCKAPPTLGHQSWISWSTSVLSQVKPDDTKDRLDWGLSAAVDSRNIKDEQVQWIKTLITHDWRSGQVWDFYSLIEKLCACQGVPGTTRHNSGPKELTWLLRGTRIRWHIAWVGDHEQQGQQKLRYGLRWSENPLQRRHSKMDKKMEDEWRKRRDNGLKDMKLAWAKVFLRGGRAMMRQVLAWMESLHRAVVKDPSKKD